MSEILFIPYDGGPSGGKTSVMANHAQRLQNAGWNPIIVPESATTLINMGFDPTDYSFQDALIREGMHHENLALLYAQKLHNPVLLCDRAIPSGKAYMQNQKDFETLLHNRGISSYGEALSRYDGLIFMQSVAVDKPEAYTTENNSARRENIEGAKIANQKQLDIWIGHKQIAVIDNSTDFETKKQRAYARLCNFLGIPEPIEAERKFLLSKIEPNHVLQNKVKYQVVDIVQHYLNKPGCRIRRRKVFSHESYYHTFKKRLPNNENVELENSLDVHEYVEALGDVSLVHAPITKKRYCFLYENQYFELDEFLWKGHPFLYLLEIELTRIQDKVLLPEFLKQEIVREVTDASFFKNENISQLLFKSGVEPFKNLT